MGKKIALDRSFQERGLQLDDQILKSAHISLGCSSKRETNHRADGIQLFIPFGNKLIYWIIGVNSAHNEVRIYGARCFRLMNSTLSIFYDFV